MGRHLALTGASAGATMSVFILRDLAPEDLDGLQTAAVHLDSVNLPDDREALAQLIARSRRSFAAVASGEPAVAKDAASCSSPPSATAAQWWGRR